MSTQTDSKKSSQLVHRGSTSGRSLLLVTTLLVAMGTVALASASEGQSVANGGSPWSIMLHDIAYLCLGVIALLVTSKVRLEQLIRVTPWLMGIGIASLLAVKAVGVSANGGQRWLNLHFIFLQPSEIFKLLTVLYLAWMVLHHHRSLNNWTQLVKWSGPVLVGATLVVIEPDIGTSSVIVAIGLAILAVAGLSRRLLARTLLAGIVLFGGYMLARPYSARRFFSFLHPSHDVLGSGYQLLQSKIGLGAGGLTGLGLGHSREKWGFLPNPHTDFIFSIVGEELGLIGTLLVLGLFVWFLLAAMRIAMQCTNQTYRLVAVGITTWIILEALINIASVVGGWAVTGIPLPFFSYGGTALITELAAVGLLYNISNDRTRSSDLTIDHFEPSSRTRSRGDVPARPSRDVIERQNSRQWR